MMRIEALPLEGAAVLRTEARRDSRGWFARWFCQEEMAALNQGRAIQQINSSFTAQSGAVRGLHFQVAPHAEDKIVRCVAGRVFDVMVDLRKNSQTFGSWHGVELDAEEMNMVYIPRGFAHGFQTLTTDCQMLYLHTDFFAPEHQGGLHYASPELGIEWPLKVTEISKRDASLPTFNETFSGLSR